MKIGGENRPEWIMKRHWQRFCETLGLSEKMLQREARRFTKTIQCNAKQLSEDTLFADYAGYKGKVLSDLITLIEERSDKLTKRVIES